MHAIGTRDRKQNDYSVSIIFYALAFFKHLRVVLTTSSPNSAENSAARSSSPCPLPNELPYSATSVVDHRITLQEGDAVRSCFSRSSFKLE